MSVFKAYDIRGVYDRDFNKEDVYKIGYFLPSLLKANQVLVGRDVRVSSPEIYEALTAGVTDAGADVLSIGLATTPMVYYATVHYRVKASVQITASHNSKEYNGLKISRENALPVGYDTGLHELDQMVKHQPIVVADKKGSIREIDAKPDYVDTLKKYLPDFSHLKISVDCSNGMAGLLVRDVLGNSPTYINETLDGTFPNHEPNPLIEANVHQLKQLVHKEGADIGIIFDGDADRVMFVDEKGQFISPDLITAVLAEYYLEKGPANVLVDIRTSKSVTDYIRSLGGNPVLWKVGHAYAKLKMREIKSPVGGELAGHYYFRDFFNCDSAMLATLIVLTVVSKLKSRKRTLSSYIESMVSYSFSGEINFVVAQKEAAMDMLKNHFSSVETPITFLDVDGYRIEFANWWFNVRQSNTEPLLRLVVEARNPVMLNEKVQAITDILNPYISTAQTPHH